MNAPQPPALPLVRRIVPHGWCLLALLAFSALVVPTVGDGIGAWDSHKIQLSVRAWLDQHQVVISRPPGHPVSEIYVFGSAGWVCEHVFGRRFDTTAFLTFQWFIATATAALFYLWLVRLKVPPTRASVAMLCLLISPQFFEQTVDGDEFILGMAFLLGSVALLDLEGAAGPRWRRLAGAIGLFALATGCRAELVVCGALLFPFQLVIWRVRDWRIWLGTALAVIAATTAAWLPSLLVNGLPPPFDPGLNVAESILGWGYKLLFVCYGFPASVLLLGLLAQAALRQLRLPRSERDATARSELLAVLLALVIIALFALSPSKPGYALAAVPFLLLLAARRSFFALGGLAALLLANAFVGIDIFRDRILSRPHLIAGTYRRAVATKAAHRLGYLQQLTRVSVSGKTVVIGDAWSFVYQHHLDRGTLSAQSVKLPANGATGFVQRDAPDRVLLPREAALWPPLLARLHENGYEIVMDRLLWRTLYARYDVLTADRTTAHVGRTPVRLVTLVEEP